jgi:hypothetical protein
VRYSQQSHNFFSKRTFIFLVVAVLTSFPALAQRTVTQDAGGGRKLELHYNAANQVTEMKTIGADGQVLQVQNLEYPPGSYVPQTKVTSYWPNGKVHRVTHDTYDLNANFTGEFIEVYDDSGKQVFGHKLTHDPQTNTYHCQDWNAAAQKYVQIECPAGEESSGPPETVKKFTQDEVTQQLMKARQAAERQEKPMPTAPAANPEATVPPEAPASAPAGTNVKEVGLIFPAKIRPGDRVSGSVVEHPESYEGQAGIRVTRIALPFTPSGTASTLAGWVVEMSGEPPQAADGPLSLTIPPGQIELAVLFHPHENSTPQISKVIQLPSLGPKTKHPTSYLAPAICLKGQACVIQGPFSGNSAKTFAAFEERPARILAETPDSAYIAIPDRTEAGPRPLAIAEGSKAIAWPMVVAQFSIEPDRRDLKQGEMMLQYVTMEGPEELPDQLWLPGNYPASTLDEARKLVPGFQLPKASREAKEKHEEDEKREAQAKPGEASGEHAEGMGGEILVVVQNPTPEQATFHGSNNGTFVFHLTASSFKQGEFKYKFVAQSLKAGSFSVKGYAIPFLAPVPGQEVAGAAPSK